MAMYGLVLQSDPGDQIQKWVPTDNPDDICRPPEQFVGCDRISEGVDKLCEMFPVPGELADNADGTYRVETVILHRSQGQVLVFPKARITRVKKSYQTPQVAELAKALVAAGGGVIGAWSSDWSEASHRQVVKELHKDAMFAASDLVFRDCREGYEVVRDPKKAKARRAAAETRKKTKTEKAQAESDSHQVDQKRREMFRDAHNAAAALWASVPALKLLPYGIGPQYSDWYHSHTWARLTAFWPVVFLHEELTRKGKWREFREVETFLDAYVSVRDTLGGDYQKHDADHHDNRTQLRAACARLDEEVKRLARKRRREQLRRDRAAQAVAPAPSQKTEEPAAV